MRRNGWSEMIADTWRDDVDRDPEKFLSDHWVSQLLDTPILLAVEVQNHLDKAEQYGADKERARIIRALDNYTLYRFDKDELVALISE